MNQDFDRQKELFFAYMQNCNTQELNDILNRLEKVKPGIKEFLLKELRKKK